MDPHRGAERRKHKHKLCLGAFDAGKGPKATSKLRAAAGERVLKQIGHCNCHANEIEMAPWKVLSVEEHGVWLRQTIMVYDARFGKHTLSQHHNSIATYTL